MCSLSERAGAVDAAAAPGGSPLRVLLVDDQHLVRAGFRVILSSEPGIEVVGEAGSGQQAIDTARRLHPDVVCMDVQMPGMDGIEATRTLTADPRVHCRVLVLTTFDREDYLFSALRAGASGFLLKNSSPEALIEAVRVVARGDALLSPEVTRRVLERFSGAEPPASAASASAAAANALPNAAAGAIPTAPNVLADAAARVIPAPSARPKPDPPQLSRLSGREREVLGLLAEGASNGEIAARLFVGEATVKTHVSNVLTKLQLRDRVQAVVWSYEHGVVQPGGEA